MNGPADGTPPADLVAALRRLGLLAADASPRFTPLPGGVSSDIWRVDLATGPICIKRALPKLKVAADWRAPTERNAYEVAWIETANAIIPGVAPRILGHDAEAGLFAMAFLDPAQHPLWKTELMAGRADPAFAMQVGHRLVTIHARTARQPTIAARFATDASFHAIRLEPYLEATARVHPDCAAALAGLVATTASTRLALVHGDVSPKNILAGPQGPVFLDAECAWYGDPAFDLAFCLNHLLLKCLWRPGARDLYIGCFNALTNAYAGGVDWEPVAAVEARAARLLPGLLLARIDGKSPVEYVTDAAQKDLARGFARRLLREPVDHLDAVVEDWEAALGAAGFHR
ncbi:MAG TPA: phosphotransferase [Methylomirabilota bacterium]|nr:phosphotransferase [Methylomirabilota bacterium]